MTLSYILSTLALCLAIYAMWEAQQCVKAQRSLYKTLERIMDHRAAVQRHEQTKCTYCGGTDFLEGPSGGLAVNVLCSNPKCRHWFNLSPFGLDDLHRVEPAKE